MKIKKNPQERAMILELSGKVMGGKDYEKFHSEIKDLIADGQKKFLLDFSGVGWINSTGIGILVSAYQSISNIKGQLKICAMNERSLSVFYVSQLHKVFATYDTREEAMAAFTNDDVQEKAEGK